MSTVNGKEVVGINKHTGYIDIESNVYAKFMKKFNEFLKSLEGNLFDQEHPKCSCTTNFNEYRMSEKEVVIKLIQKRLNNYSPTHIQRNMESVRDR